MPPAPTDPTDAYLDVLGTLAVPDAALRRHHGVAPDGSLRAAIDGTDEVPTDALFDALAATGRLLDLRDGLAADDGDRLTAALAPFGLVCECTAAGGDLEVLVYDAVDDGVDRLRFEAGATDVADRLTHDLLRPAGIELAALLDGRHLVADRAQLDALRERYGDRIQPFETPLLTPAAADTLPEPAPERAGAAAIPRRSVESESSSPAGVTDDGTASAIPSPPTPEATADDSRDADADVESVDEVLAEADEETAESIEATLAESGPRTHTVEGTEEELDADASATIGGGPRTTVSTKGIDEVFEQLEASAEASAALRSGLSETAAGTAPTDPDTDSPDDVAPEASSDPTATATGDATEQTSAGLSGGPKRTVSGTSADDILQRATGEQDFEDIAESQPGADPDAVLDNADDVPGDVAAGAAAATASAPADSESGDAPPDDSAGDRDAADADGTGPGDDAGGSTPAADVEPADPDTPPGAPPAADDPDAGPKPLPPEALGATSSDPESTKRDIAPASGTEAAEPAESSPDDPSIEELVASATPEAPDDSSPDASEGGGSEEPADAAGPPPDLGDELVGDDVELRRGSEPVEDVAEESATDVPIEHVEPDRTDGPLAAEGGVGSVDGPSRDPAAEGSAPSTAPDAEQDATTTDTEESDDADDGETGQHEDDDDGLLGRIGSIFRR